MALSQLQGDPENNNTNASINLKTNLFPNYLFSSEIKNSILRPNNTA